MGTREKLIKACLGLRALAEELQHRQHASQGADRR